MSIYAHPSVVVMSMARKETTDIETNLDEIHDNIGSNEKLPPSILNRKAMRASSKKDPTPILNSDTETNVNESHVNDDCTKENETVSFQISNNQKKRVSYEDCQLSIPNSDIETNSVDYTRRVSIVNSKAIGASSKKDPTPILNSDTESNVNDSHFNDDCTKENETVSFQMSNNQKKRVSYEDCQLSIPSRVSFTSRRHIFENSKRPLSLRMFNKPAAVTQYFSQERIKLMFVKSCFAIIWGITNVIVVFSTQNRDGGGARYATMMTGNTIILAEDVYHVNDNKDYIGIIFTVGMMFSYLLGSCCFNICWFSTAKDKRGFVIFGAFITTILMGVLADVLRFTLKNNDKVKVFFCLPISTIAGIISSGYCERVAYGRESSQLTGHFSNVALHIAKRATAKLSDEERENFYMSLIIISFYFVGAIIGYTLEKWVNSDDFTPIYITVSTLLSILVLIHYRLHLYYNEGY